MGDLQDVAQALQHFEPALELAKKLNDNRHSLMLMNNIAVMRTYRGELRQAIAILADSAKMKEEQRDFTGAAVTLNNLAVLSFRVGDVLKALETAHHALDMARANDDWVGIATALEGNRRLLLQSVPLRRRFDLLPGRRDRKPQDGGRARSGAKPRQFRQRLRNAQTVQRRAGRPDRRAGNLSQKRGRRTAKHPPCIL